MSQPWNLTPEQWSHVLLDNVDPQAIANNLHRAAIQPWTNTLIKYTQHSKTTLDLGSGAGQPSAILALAGKQTTLMDWSPENLQFSKKLFETLKLQGEFCRGDMLKPLPFKNNSFDTVFSCGVFEYFSDSEIEQILKEAFRVAAKNVIILVPNALSIAYRVGKFYQEKTGAWEWGGERPFPTLKPYFRAVGCRNITEMTVAAKLSLDFLTMRGSGLLKRMLIRGLQLKSHDNPAKLKQGYLLISIGEKKQST
jgi:SAM-dependent methyltransferase